MPTQIFSSTEPKASETARLVAATLGVSTSECDGLHEHDRTTTPYQDQAAFRASVARFFAEPEALVYGSETAAEARNRFSAAIDGIVQQHPDGNLVVVAHGTVITLFVAQYNQIEPFDFWRRLGLPSYTVLALPDFRLLSVVESVEE